MSDEKVLKNGSTGDDVRTLQAALQKIGFEIEVDGHYGPGTEKAVRLMQDAFNYNIDGMAGQATKFLINQQLGFNWRWGMPTEKYPQGTAPAVDPNAKNVKK